MSKNNNVVTLKVNKRAKTPGGRRVLEVIIPTHIDLDDTLSEIAKSAFPFGSSSDVRLKSLERLQASRAAQARERVAAAARVRRSQGESSRRRVEREVLALRAAGSALNRDETAEVIHAKVGLSVSRVIKILTALRLFRHPE